MAFQLFSITFISMVLFPVPCGLLHKDAQKTRQLWSVQQGPFNNDWMMPIVPLPGSWQGKEGPKFFRWWFSNVRLLKIKCSSPKNHHQIAPATNGNHHQQNCAPFRTYFFYQNCAPLRNYQTKRSPTLPERWWGIALWVPTYSNFPLREFLFLPIINSRIFFWGGECFINRDGNGFAS